MTVDLPQKTSKICYFCKLNVLYCHLILWCLSEILNDRFVTDCLQSNFIGRFCWRKTSLMRTCQSCRYSPRIHRRTANVSLAWTSLRRFYDSLGRTSGLIKITLVLALILAGWNLLLIHRIVFSCCVRSYINSRIRARFSILAVRRVRDGTREVSPFSF